MVSKKSSVLIVLILIFSLGFVSSANIFKISGNTDAHAGTLSSSYPNVMTLNKDPIGTNNVLWLSANTNAHTSTIYNTAYEVGINVGTNYNCALQTSNSCPAGEECLVALSAPTNAHAANCETPGYKNFCCKLACVDECTINGCEGKTPYTCEMQADGCTDKISGTDCGQYQNCAAGACTSCPLCTDCDTFFGGCDHNKCHECEGGGCLYLGTRLGENCVALNEENCNNHITTCSDYEPSECDSNPCNVGSNGCILDGADWNCKECIANSDCGAQDFPYCSNGECVECISDDNCPEDGPTGNFRCQDNQVEKEMNDNYCNDQHSCAYTTNWEVDDPCEDIPENDHYTDWVCTDKYTRQQEYWSYYPLCSEEEGCTYPHTTETNTTTAGTNEICRDGEFVKNLFWVNMKGEEITNAEIGDTVLMAYLGGDNSQDYVFDIYEEDTLTPDDEIKLDIPPLVSEDSSVIGKWVITQEDFNKGVEIGELLDNHIEAYFKIDNKKSPELIVNENEDNSPPSTQIISPLDEATYTIVSPATKTSDIDFIHNSSDEDDDLEIVWDFGDGETSGGLRNCLTTGNCNETHSYTDSGTKGIILTTKEMTRDNPQIAYDNVNIYVYKEGLNVFSKINHNVIEGRMIVDMNGNESKVVECFKDSADGLYEVTDRNGGDSLWCKDLPPPTPSTYDLIMEWIFDANIPREQERLIGTWLQDYDKVVEFAHFFKEFGLHTIKLNVGYVPS